MKGKVLLVTLAAIVLVIDAAGDAAFVHAQQRQVQMPKEGSFELDFCIVAQAVVPISSDQFTIIHYIADANLRTEPAGRPFDRQSARCWGTIGFVKGKGEEYGLCEVIDQDGDKWYAEAHGDGTKGTYTAPHGTGKYEGMTLQAEYRFVQWPAGPAGTSRACNPNRGTYKMR